MAVIVMLRDVELNIAEILVEIERNT